MKVQQSATRCGERRVKLAARFSGSLPSAPFGLVHRARRRGCRPHCSFARNYISRVVSSPWSAYARSTSGVPHRSVARLSFSGNFLLIWRLAFSRARACDRI